MNREELINTFSSRISDKCNTEIDCKDKSDEHNCDFMFFGEQNYAKELIPRDEVSTYWIQTRPSYLTTFGREKLSTYSTSKQNVEPVSDTINDEKSGL